MALIEFKNLPDTTTPLTAQNLNNNFNELKPSIISIKVGDDYSWTSPTQWDAGVIHFDTVLNSYNNSFTLENYGIKIGSNTNMVKVTVRLEFYGSTDQTGIFVYKNNAYYRNVLISPVDTGTTEVNLTNLLVDVQPNDVLTFAIYSNASGITRYITARTYATVERVG